MPIQLSVSTPSPSQDDNEPNTTAVTGNAAQVVGDLADDGTDRGLTRGLPGQPQARLSPVTAGSAGQGGRALNAAALNAELIR